jgi:signal peptidase I
MGEGGQDVMTTMSESERLRIIDELLALPDCPIPQAASRHFTKAQKLDLFGMLVGEGAITLGTSSQRQPRKETRNSDKKPALTPSDLRRFAEIKEAHPGIPFDSLPGDIQAEVCAIFGFSRRLPSGDLSLKDFRYEWDSPTAGGQAKKLAVVRSRSKDFWYTVRALIYAVAILLAIRTFLYEPFNIPSGSMKPTLLVGDYLFVSKMAYGYSKYSLPFSLPLFEGRINEHMPNRGDVVVFKLPSDNRTDFIRRIIGLPGDKIQVKDDILYINGDPVKRVRLEDFHDDDDGSSSGPVPHYRETLPNGRSYTVLDITTHGSLDNTRVYEVPAGHVFAMGDNRDNSLDSRIDAVGFIPIENLIGRAEIVFFSTNRSARLWEIWNWPDAIRVRRLLHVTE